MPLPSEDTTPPVTKIRGVMKFSRAGNRHFSGIGVQPRGINANYWRKIQLAPKNAAPWCVRHAANQPKAAWVGC
jgi:hypothetical protein